MGESLHNWAAHRGQENQRRRDGLGFLGADAKCIRAGERAPVVPAALLASVFVYRLTSMEFGPIVVDTFPEAVVASLLGAVLLMIELFIANVVVSILRRYVSVRIAGFRFGQDA